MGKTVKAVKPFIYKNNSNFKLAVYDAWCKLGGKHVGKRKYEHLYERLSYHLPLPTFLQDSKQARLRFVEAANMPFDTFPDYLYYEIIPVFWDCWPRHIGQVSDWLNKHHVKTAFFTSSQTAEKIRESCPGVNACYMPEAIETNLYKAGGTLSERKYDYLEFGRCCNYVDTSSLSSAVRVLSSRNEKGALATRQLLIDALADSKITICLPRSVNQPDIAGDIETLTQRYWECMLSRVIIIGKAPRELVDIIGYDPVVELHKDKFAMQVEGILAHLDDYQELVDKNRVTALKHGDWIRRVEEMRNVLQTNGYEL